MGSPVRNQGFSNESKSHTKIRYKGILFDNLQKNIHLTYPLWKVLDL